MKRRISRIGIGVSALALSMMMGSHASAEIIGQWDFNSGDFTATAGNDLTYFDPFNNDAIAGTVFGSTTALGIPDIGGSPASVMKFPTAEGPNIANFGYLWDPTNDIGNGGGIYINQYTMIMDIMIPASSIGTWVAFYSAYAFSAADAEFFKNTSGGIGVNGDYAGEMLADTWHRVVVVVDTSDFDTGVIKKYIDGVKVGQQNIEGQDLRWALDNDAVGMFMDNDGDVHEGYVNSIQWRDILLNDGQVAALGGPTAAGIPEVLPQAPSFIESWTPAIDYALPDTDMEVVINAGDATISGITFSLDGVAQTPSITTVGPTTTVFLANAAAGGPFLVGTIHTNVVSYSDDVAGVTVTASNVFEVPLFLEDFEGVVLEASPEENPARTDVWSKTGPAGWVNDDSLNPGFGDPSTDGVADWAGWVFANKGFWVEVSGDQGRSAFSAGVGTVVIADGDEWDDDTHSEPQMNTYISSPPIPLGGATANSAFLIFDSSWWDYDDQTATIDVSFDGGATSQILRWSSRPADPDYHGDYSAAGVFSRNERVTVPMNNPDGATDVVVTFGYTTADNDWWWAFDNVVVKAGLVAPFINGQPQDAEVTEGDPATFTVDAGGGALTYQWYTGTGAGRTAIDGATGPEYTIAATTLADHLSIYSVDVINSAGTQTSAEVELRVIELLSGTTLLAENFDALPLGPPIDEALCGDVWSPDPPAGWILDNSGVAGFGDPATDGVREWAGWSFADRDWWATVAGDQNRTLFTLGTGVVAIADGDEWDDAPHTAGTMNTFLTTPPISVAGAAANTVQLTFDSSWRDDPVQVATVAASYDGAPAVVVLRWASDAADPDFKDDAENEMVTIPLNNPAGAANVVLTFGYTDAGNDWWWAFDNLVVDDGTTTYFAEDFEGVALGQPVEEEYCGGPEGVWTDTPPTDWVVDDSGVPTIGDPLLGTTEWEGWAFVDPAAWAAWVPGNRGQFTKGSGVIAVAEPEGWYDRGAPDPFTLGSYNALLTTPAISLSGVEENTVAVRFDSSWRPYKSTDPINQTAVLTVSYDGGPAVELLRWESDAAGPNYKATDYNETVTFHLANPAGAANMVLEFAMLNSGNDYWWAVDNLLVLTEVLSPGITSFSVSGGTATVIWENPGSADQLQQVDDPVNGTWGDVGAPTDQGTATVPATGDVMLLRITQP